MMRILPLAHLAVEVPWQESWDGTGMGDFLSEDPRSLPLQHPLGHRHPYSVLRPTTLELPPFSVAAAPRWLEKAEAEPEETGVFARYALPWQPALEPAGSSRIERIEHQQTLGDSFFSAVRPEESLLFLYARRTPLSADARPVLVGIGRVTGVGSPQEWESAEPEELTSLLPYRAVEHSIRPDQEEGCTFPYARLLALFPHDPDLSAEGLACVIPEEIQKEFRGGACLVDHDAAVALLAAACNTLRSVHSAVPGNGTAPLPWVEAEKLRVRELRGDAPGAASALRALGVRAAPAILADLADKPGPLWPRVEKALSEQEGLSPQTQHLLPPSFGKVWELLSSERRDFLRLLARFALTPEQAIRLYNLRQGPGDREVLENPWLLAELDAANPDPVHLRTLDRGLSTSGEVNEHRLRALASAALQEAAADGHTLLPADALVRAMEWMSLDPPCPINSELLAVLPYEVEGGRGIRMVKMWDGSLGFQLERVAHYGEVIRKAIRQRALRRFPAIPLDEPEEEDEEAVPEPSVPARPTLTLIRSEPEPEPEPTFSPGIGFRSANSLRPSAEQAPPPSPPPPPIPAVPSWTERLNAALAHPAPLDPRLEEQARAEKLAALAELYESRCSVLVAPPATGANLLLRVLAEALESLVLIAPTAELLAEASLPRSEGLTVDRLPAHGSRWRNVVVLHAQMLGERELAKLLYAARSADRVILVGDPSLPMPSSLGRPFVDLVEHLAPPEGQFPRVAAGYAELTIRVVKADRLRVADWFSGRPLPAGANEARDVPERFGVRFVSWDRTTDVSKRLIEAMTVSLELETEEDFCKSISENDTLRRSWQVLAPYRGGSLGVDELNRRLQQHFRPQALAAAVPPAHLAPVGWEGLIPGDKVVAVRGGRRMDVHPPTASAPLAAGELGLIVGEKPWKLDVQFRGHPGVRHGFSLGEFPTDGDGPIALAYALSVRWGQGLNVPVVYLVVPDKGVLTREMIYAAISMATERVVIFHPGASDDLFRHEFPRVSDASRRYTNLFRRPQPAWLPTPGVPGEERALGEALTAADLDILYQNAVEAPDGSQRWPTFRFEDTAGRPVYWEHFGPARCTADLHVRAEIEDWYRELGILSDAEAPWGGPNGLLLITEGDEWKAKLEELIG